ncbi:phospholipase A2 [Streptomyces sp. NPDC094032]|uniref:phospholipase A2 n=1 Tax=Streptomyces sp. NPDC094032 TaxID=3155308 RepID=UPI00331C7085
MRRLTLPAVAALSMALLLPQQTATADTIAQPQATGGIQPIGPGLYYDDIRSFQIAETDAVAGSVGRRHSVTVQADGVARPESAADSRNDLGVFGPSWEAEFLGGTTNRKLQQQGDAVVVTDLGVNEATRYAFTDNVSFPDGGGISKYAAADGSRLTETTRWDDLAGDMVTTIVETLGVDLAATESGDDRAVDANGNALSAADLKPTYTWKQAAPGSDTWRVTGVGNKASGTSSVGYDAQGRVSSIVEPASAEEPEQHIAVSYASATTAAGAGLGDYAGRVKEITVTSGATVQTVASYTYDGSGLLREVTNPVESSSADKTYAYDSTGRVSAVSSATSGSWDLSFPAGSAAPDVESTGPARPAQASTLEGAAGINDPNAIGPPASDITGELGGASAYPWYCSTATSWMWYTSSGCAAWVAHYGWRYPQWKQLPSGYWVVGINHDHCTQSPDRPSGYDFRTACDMHDYGYGLIGNTYKGYRYYLDRSKKSAVDDVFYTTLRDYTCSAYRWKSVCRGIAWTYRKGVNNGNPKNGANAT